MLWTYFNMRRLRCDSVLKTCGIITIPTTPPSPPIICSSNYFEVEIRTNHAKRGKGVHLFVFCDKYPTNQDSSVPPSGGAGRKRVGHIFISQYECKL